MSESIKVAVRIRPLVDTEISKGCQNSIEVSSSFPQVQIGKDKVYTYNFVFDQDSTQEDLYCACVENLVKELFKGFNVTILAYGQTGSGKTHTMGTCYNGFGDKGVIPRAVEDIFRFIESNSGWEFRVFVSFLELYNEQLYDLLSNERAVVDLREDTKGIIIPGLTEKPVYSSEGTMSFLQAGASGRVTGATAMNNQSSRSHAIFTITIHQQRQGDANSATTSKFHLVDLAGSERSKKTQAVGERLKEGININNGLLHLGNVIQSLGDGSKHIPSFRNSKLTRLLQDSLGGNSLTLMIACVSPADYNVDETLSTLRYADRARRIKNKPVVNQDPKAAEIQALKQKIQELQLNQNRSCPASHDLLEEENKKLNNKLRIANQRYNDALNENTIMCERILLVENAKDNMKQKVSELEEEIKVQVDGFSKILNTISCPDAIKSQFHVLEANMRLKLTSLHEEHKRSEVEIRAHQKGSEQTISNNINNDFSTSVESNLDSEELEQQQEELANKQIELTKELKQLTRELALKEEICEKYALQDDNLKQNIKLKSLYEDQIKKLVNERAELLTSIKLLQAANKETELKAKQLELSKKNHEIEVLQKRLESQSKIVKQKEAAEKKVELLNREIVQMKQAKVKLIRQMKAEGEKFRNWQILRERETTKLRDQDRKRQNEIAKMVSLHHKQQNVYKRKLEEASACNKRLKEVLSRQKMVQDKRYKGNKEQVQDWVAHELEVLVSVADAKQNLQLLMDDRASLTAQVTELTKVIEDVNTREDDKREAEKELREVREDLELRNVQITDLQQKILDSDPENKMNVRWDVLQSMSDAKLALKHSFLLVTEIKKEAIVKDCELKELQYNYEMLMKKTDSLQKEVSRMKEQHKEEMLRLENEMLTGQDKENIEPDLNATFTLEISKKLEEKKEECQKLKEQLTTISKVVQHTPKNKRVSLHREFEDLNYDNLGGFVDDIYRHPGLKNTPMVERLKEAKAKPYTIQESNKINRKRTADGLTKCGCTTTCNTKRCNCRKMGSRCSPLCSCNPEICTFQIDSPDETSNLLDTTMMHDNKKCKPSF